MANRKTLAVVLGIVVVFVGLVALIVVMLANQFVTFQMATLMLVALLGLYVGFGILIAIYRLVIKLE
ncbi:MAG: hypothetical protein O7C67_20100 [Gammaproteobacteria bacterium]|nr:hypothetical protein [Gammaproteobacteria bacterium]